MTVVSEAVLPDWAVVTPKRREHVARVIALLAQWAHVMQLPSIEFKGWLDAGAWHDSLRDESETTLRAMTGDHERPVGMLHGPAAALRLEANGEHRLDVLEAIKWHTVGNARWSRAGRALYMADFLEPGRTFMQADRAFLAERVPDAFDAVFRQVVRMRIEWVLREGKGLSNETVELWNSVR